MPAIAKLYALVSYIRLQSLCNNKQATFSLICYIIYIYKVVVYTANTYLTTPISPSHSDMFVNGIFKKRRGALTNTGMAQHSPEQNMTHPQASMSHHHHQHPISSSPPSSSCSSSSSSSPSRSEHNARHNSRHNSKHSTIDTSALNDQSPPSKRARMALKEDDEAAMASKVCVHCDEYTL